MVILSIFFFITAILYSSVGFGGGSTYLALMLIWDIPYYIFPIIALFCNIIVVSGNSINYIKSGNLNFKLLIPYLIGSVPFAFFGASISIGKELFEILLFLMKAGYPKHIATTASLFILINSIFGVAGQLTKDIVINEFFNYWPLFVAVLVGGQIGNYINIKFLSNKTLALLTSLLVIFVAGRMGFRILP